MIKFFQFRFFILLVFTNLLLIKTTFTQTITKSQLEGIYYGSIAKGYSQLKEPMVFRFYKSGLVLIQILNSQPSNLEVLENAFSEKNKNKFSNASYHFNDGYIEFYAPMKGLKTLFEGAVKTMDDDVIIQFVAKDSKGGFYNIIVNKVWPEKPVYTPPPKGEKTKPITVQTPTNQPTEQTIALEKSEELTEALETSVEENMENSEMKKAIQDINALGALEFEKGNYEASSDHFNDVCVIRI